jgi:hypothetical protein
MIGFEVQLGLPPYGPQALPFSANGQGMHSEGLVVRFTADDDTCWTGNFQPGLGQCETVLRHPDNRRFVVIAGGQAYVIDPNQSSSWEHFGGDIETALEIHDLNALLFGNGLWFELLGANGMIWQTRRISWDEMRDLKIQGLTLTGRSSCYDDTWSDFTVDLVEGTVTGGSYNGPGSPENST